MSFFIRNLTGSSIEINDLGLTLETGVDLNLTQEPANSIAISDDLVSQINLGNIIVLDPLDESRQLDVVNSVKCVQLANDPHFGIQVGFLDQLDDVSVPAPTHDYVLTYDSPNNDWRAKPSQGGGGGGDSTSVREIATQVAHGYITGQAVYHDGTAWQLARSNILNTLATAVIEVTGLNTFNVISDGDITSMSNLTAGEWYYVSDITPGAITTVEPSLFSNPVGYAESITKFHVVSIRAQDLSGMGGNQPGISKKLVVQGNHGFNTGQPVYLDNNGLYVLAQANNVNTLATAIIEIVDVNSFYLVDGGDIENMSGLVVGTWYYVSDITLGELITTEPESGFSNPMGYADTPTKLHVVSLRAQDLSSTTGGGGISKKLIVQNNHGFNTGQPSYFDGTLWQLAFADNINTLGTVIIETIDLNSFYVVDSGDVESMTGLIPGSWYYVSDTTIGQLTIIEPESGFSNPMGYADTTTQLHVVFARAVDLSSGIDSASDKKIIIQNNHGFNTGQPIYFDGTIWQLAQANSLNTLATEVVIVIDVNTFEAVSLGSVDGMINLTPGTWYFVDSNSPGTLVVTEPAISNPMGVAESTSKLFVIPMRAVDYTNE